MADIAIYTACFGGYDRVLPQTDQDVPVDWICLSDDPAFSAPAPWRTEHVDVPDGVGPNLSAKAYKAAPPWVLGDVVTGGEFVGWSHMIWIDANMEITEPAFAREAIGYVHDGIAVWRHPRRTTVADEIAASAPGGTEDQDGKYADVPLRAMGVAWAEEGFPDDGGFYASGTIVWERGRRAAEISQAWLHEIMKWRCFHDQLVLPVVAWRLGLRPGVFGVHQIERRYSSKRPRRVRGVQVDPNAVFYLANRWLRIWPHAARPER